MARENIFHPEFTYDPDDPDGYRAGMRRFGPDIGAAMLGGSIYELPPGQSICPYHYEYGNEEWLVVLDGAPLLRTPAGEETLAPGEVICFPPGAGGAHKVTNRGDTTLHVLMLSTMIDPSVSVYPDSDKIGVWPGDRRDNLMLRRRDGAAEYYDGE